MGRNFLHQLHLTLWTILVLTLGYFFGSFLLRVESVDAPEAVHVLTRDRDRRAPFVYVKEIQDGKIVGVVGTGARLMVGETVVVPRRDRTFEVPAAPFLVNMIDVPVPRGAQFVASRRGKNYYPVRAAASERLKPENRLYFRSAMEAEEMGYKRGKY